MMLPLFPGFCMLSGKIVSVFSCPACLHIPCAFHYIIRHQEMPSFFLILSNLRPKQQPWSCEYLLQEQSPFLTYISHCDTFLTLRASCTMSSKNFQFTTALDKEEMNLKEKLPGMSVEEQYDLLPPTECMYPSWFP